MEERYNFSLAGLINDERRPRVERHTASQRNASHESVVNLDKLKQLFFSGLVKRDKKKEQNEEQGFSGAMNPNMQNPPVPPKDGLSDYFSKLNLSDGSRRRQEFVGGFKHGPANPDSARTSSSSTPSFPVPVNQHGAPLPPHVSSHSQTMAMPQPQVPYLPHRQMSRTMQYALNNDWSAPSLATTSLTPLPPRAQSEELLIRRESNDQTPDTNSEQDDSSETKRPKPSRKKVPNKSDGKTQCAGITRKGGRCTRQVKDEPWLNVIDPDANAERFCFQHLTEIQEPKGFYSQTTPRQYVTFSDFIPSYLHEQTQASLRKEMAKPPSSADVPGYIYAFEIRDPDDEDIVHIKVGRAVSLNKRIDEWSKQCGSKTQVLLGWWPGNIHDKRLKSSLLKGCVEPGYQGRACHRLERLIHLELADLVLTETYLQKKFPNLNSQTNSKEEEKKTHGRNKSHPNTPTKSPGKRIKTARTFIAGSPCDDCGAIHREIFSFKRSTQGPLKDMEWEKIVMPVIEKWGKFVDTYLPDPAEDET